MKSVNKHKRTFINIDWPKFPSIWSSGSRSKLRLYNAQETLDAIYGDLELEIDLDLDDIEPNSDLENVHEEENKVDLPNVNNGVYRCRPGPETRAKGANVVSWRY